jgi:WD40 repeat protein
VSSGEVGAVAQTVSRSGAVGVPGPYLSPKLCKEPKGTIIPVNTGHVDSVAYSLNGAWLAEVEEPATGLPKGTYEPGTLRIYRVRGHRLISRSCRTLPWTGKNPTPEPYYAVAFGPTGLLAVTNVGKNTVTLYSVSAGKTHQVSVFTTGKDPDAVAFGPTQSGGEAVSVANWGDNSISMFTDSSGFIAPAAGSPVATVAGPSSVAFSPKGILAVAGSGDNLVYDYSVSYVAGLSGVGAAHTDDRALSVAFSTTGELLGTANPTDAEVFSVATTGLLSPVGGSPFSSGGDSIAFDHHAFLLALALGGGTAVYNYALS